MGAKYSEMYASSCVVFGERILGSVSVSGPVSVSHGILYKVEVVVLVETIGQRMF